MMYSANYDDEEQKIQAYHKVVFSTSHIYLRTLRKLLAHLQEVTAQSKKNFASIDNICKIFGPTIFSVTRVCFHMNNKMFFKIYSTLIRYKYILGQWKGIARIIFTNCAVCADNERSAIVFWSHIWCQPGRNFGQD